MTTRCNVGIWIGSSNRKRENYRIKYSYYNKAHSLGNSIMPMLISSFDYCTLLSKLNEGHTQTLYYFCNFSEVKNYLSQSRVKNLMLKKIFMFGKIIVI